MILLLGKEEEAIMILTFPFRQGVENFRKSGRKKGGSGEKRRVKRKKVLVLFIIVFGYER